MSKRSLFIIIVVAIGLGGVGLLGGDLLIFRRASAYSKVAGDETSRLGSALSLIEIFGKADTWGLIALLTGWFGARRKSIGIFIALLAVAIVVLPLKDTVKRMRPDRSERKSFPSGDTATVGALVFSVGNSPATTAGYGALTGAVAMSRIFFSRHYLSDVIAGGIIGVLAGLIGVKSLPLIESFLRQKFRRSKWEKLNTSAVLPPRWIFGVGALALLAGEFRAAYYAGHTLHIWRFLIFFSPIIAVIFARQFCRLRFRRRKIEPAMLKNKLPNPERILRKFYEIPIVAAVIAAVIFFITPDSDFYYRQLLVGALLFGGVTAWFYRDLRRRQRFSAAKIFTRFAAAIFLIWLIALAIIPLLPTMSAIRSGNFQNGGGNELLYRVSVAGRR